MEDAGQARPEGQRCCSSHLRSPPLRHGDAQGSGGLVPLPGALPPRGSWQLNLPGPTADGGTTEASGANQPLFFKG